MTLKKYTSLAVIALAASVWIGCSSQEDRDAYDKYYGKENKAREEAAVVEIQKLKTEASSATVVTETAPPAVEGEVSAAPTVDAGDVKVEEKQAEPVAEAKPKKKAIPADVQDILNKNACLACHQPYDKVIGPAYSEIAKKKYTAEQIVELVHKPKPEHWPGYPPMAPMAHVPAADIKIVANWINSL